MTPYYTLKIYNPNSGKTNYLYIRYDVLEDKKKCDILLNYLSQEYGYTYL